MVLQLMYNIPIPVNMPLDLASTVATISCVNTDSSRLASVVTMSGLSLIAKLPVALAVILVYGRL